MELIAPKFGLFFWTVTVFLTLFFILKKFAWKAIINALDERERTITSKLEAAAAAEAKMLALTSQNEALLKEARAERDFILKEARELREKMVSEAKEKAAAEAQKQIEAANQQITQAKNAAIAQLREQTATLSVEIAEKVLRGQLGDKAKADTLARDLASNFKLN